jgi:hypothetical protein
VVQVLSSKKAAASSYRPRPASGAHTIWGRTQNGRPLLVVTRRLTRWDWQIIGARTLTDEETADFEAWETTA